MSLNVEFLEDGEIESDTDDLSKCRKSTSASDVRENGHDRVNGAGDAAKSEERSSRPSRRKRRRDSRERSGSREKTKSSLPMDPVVIAEMDEYEMLCIRGASPPPGNPFSTIDETYQPLLEKNAASTFYEYEREHRYDSDDEGYSKRRGSPPHKRRRDRGRRRNRPNKRSSPDRRDRRRRSNSADDQESREERKMEICKFYLLECCVKRSICKYMHSEFPCKYFHLGLECQNEKPCKFSHGKALSEEMTQALARHVAAAPKAILGNFKRYSRDKALIMIQAKNRQLNEENGISGKDTLPNEKESKSSKKSSTSSSKRSKQSQQDISAIFTAQQIEKLTALGVTNLQQVKEMSLAQLTDIGMSLNQIGELQKIAENDQKYSDLPLTLLCKPQDEGVEANAPKGDMDMRQMLPMLSTTKNTMKDINRSVEENSNIGSEGYKSPVKEDTQQKADTCLEQKPNEHESSQDSALSFVDDEPELVIDESIDTSEGHVDNDNIKDETVANFYRSSPSNIWDAERNDSRSDRRSSPTSSEEELLDSISFEDAFEPFSFYSENKENNNVKTVQTKSPQKEKTPEKSPVLSDFDMRLPFADVIANYVPAMEIDASIRSHLGIKYKLVEILLPEKKDPAVRPENIPENTSDPRLKKLLSTRSTKVENTSPTPQTDKKSTMNFINPYKAETQSSEISVDPRKRREQASEPHPKPIQQNFNYVLNSFLQKAKWYQNLNSKFKMEINQHLADLTIELNKFSQNSSRDKVFQISELSNAIQVSEILSEIGLEINKDGIIQERKLPSNPEPTEFNLPPVPEVFSKDIPSLLSMGSNQKYPIPNSTFPQNTPILQNNIMPAIPPMPHQRFEFPKPGLLGIAPGIEGPQLFIHAPNNGPNFNNGMSPVIWNDPPSNFVHQPNIPKRLPGLEDMNRNPFAVKMGKRWNRKPGVKKPRRI